MRAEIVTPGLPQLAPGFQQVTPPGQSSSGKASKGLLLLQIDGLSYENLVDAMGKGYAPNLKKLVDSKQYLLHPFLCGIPAETIPFQSAIYYGIRIPANEWYSKKEKKVIDSIEYEEVVKRQALASGERGLIRGGTELVNPLDGGAKPEDTAVTVKTLYDERRNLGTFRALSKEIWRCTKILKKSFWKVPLVSWKLVRTYCSTRGQMKKNRQWNTWWDRHYPLLLGVADHVFPGLIASGIIRSMKEGRPVSHGNFTAYDEKAHYLGKDTKDAYQSLKCADAKIGDILKYMKKHKTDYNVVIFSDHVQTRSRLFKDEYGKRLHDVILDYANQVSKVGKVTEKEIAASHAYSLLNVYVHLRDGAVLGSEIEQRYPGLIKKIADHPGMGMVVSREKDALRITGKDGELLITKGASVITGKNPLEMYADQYQDRDTLAKQIWEYAQVPETGDLILFSAYKDGRVFDFNDNYSLVSSHGGLGGGQNVPFAIYDPKSGFDPSQVKEALELYVPLKQLKCRV